MHLEASCPLPAVLQWTPSPRPFGEVESACTAILEASGEEGPHVVLMSSEDWDAYQDDWGQRGMPRAEDAEAAIAAASSRDMGTFWAERESRQLAYEEYGRRQPLRLAEALILESVAAGELTVPIEELLSTLAGFARQVEQTRRLVPFQTALDQVGRDVLDGHRDERGLHASSPLQRACKVGAEELVHVMLFDAPPWQLPAWLGFGGFNHCPPVEEQLLVLRSWQEAYGARIVHLGLESLGLCVPSAPMSMPQLRRLALQQWLYCADKAPSAEAALLRAGDDAWHFRWD